MLRNAVDRCVVCSREQAEQRATEVEKERMPELENCWDHMPKTSQASGL